jgi:hypothetical protein
MLVIDSTLPNSTLKKEEVNFFQKIIIVYSADVVQYSKYCTLNMHTDNKYIHISLVANDAGNVTGHRHQQL